VHREFLITLYINTPVFIYIYIHEGINPLGSSGSKWGVNIIQILKKEDGRGGGDWNDLAQDRDT
jgi:hypothetical protein